VWILITMCVIFDLIATMFLLAVIFPGSLIDRLIVNVASTFARVVLRRRGTS
jgi:lauroyl/myristoyl acyltransferase